MKIFILNKKKIIAFSIIAILSLSFLGINNVVTVSNTVKRQIPIYSVKRNDKKIALTFNCAWGNEDIDIILDTLKKHNTKATFFIVGTWAEKYPEAVQKIADAGHDIGGHSYNHGHYKDMSYEEILADIKKCRTAIENAGKCSVNFVRGGYGEYNNDVIDACKESGNTYIQWSKDSLDYKAKTPEEIISRTTKNIIAGDIILMHSGTLCTAKSLDSILTELTKNYEPVGISDLIYTDNFTIDHSGLQTQKEL